MRCKYCNSLIADDSAFCEQCGHLLSPKNKQAVTCDISLVKWLLYGMMFVLCAMNLLVGFHFDNSDNVDTVVFLWWIIPFLSLIICVVSLVLTKKKKISVIFTVVMFFLFSANVAEMAIGIACLQEEYYETIGVTIYPHGGSSYVLIPPRWDYNSPRYNSYQEAYQAVEQMGFPHELSSDNYDLDIGPRTIRKLKTSKTQTTVAVVTIIEGVILVLLAILHPQKYYQK